MNWALILTIFRRSVHEIILIVQINWNSLYTLGEAHHYNTREPKLILFQIHELLFFKKPSHEVL